MSYKTIENHLFLLQIIEPEIYIGEIYIAWTK